MCVNNVWLPIYDELEDDLLKYLQDPTDLPVDPKLKSLQVVIGTVFRVQPYSGRYPMGGTEAIVRLGFFNWCAVVNQGANVGQSVAVLTNLQPDCESDYQRFRMVKTDPSPLLRVCTPLKFSAQDQEGEESRLQIRVRLAGICTTLFFLAVAHFPK